MVTAYTHKAFTLRNDLNILKDLDKMINAVTTSKVKISFRHLKFFFVIKMSEIAM